MFERQGNSIKGNPLGPKPWSLVVPWARSNPPGYLFDGNKFDLDKWNPEYFARLKDFIAKAGERGIAAIVQTWGLRKEDSRNYLPESQMVRLMRYLEARYGANHVVWILTGDAHYEGEQGERFKRIGRTVFGGRPHAPTTCIRPACFFRTRHSARRNGWISSSTKGAMATMRGRFNGFTLVR